MQHVRLTSLHPHSEVLGEVGVAAHTFGKRDKNAQDRASRPRRPFSVLPTIDRGEGHAKEPRECFLGKTETFTKYPKVLSNHTVSVRYAEAHVNDLL